MGVWEASGLAFAAVFGLMMVGMPIAFAMLIVGLSGIWLAISDRTAMGMIGQLPFSATMSYELSVIPMFILMGVLVTKAHMSQDLYRLCHGFIGHRRGGLAYATILACGGFSALSGSSIATAATMAKVAVPEMRRDGLCRTERRGRAHVAAGRASAGIAHSALGDMTGLYGYLRPHGYRPALHAGIIPGHRPPSCSIFGGRTGS